MKIQLPLGWQMVHVAPIPQTRFSPAMGLALTGPGKSAPRVQSRHHAWNMHLKTTSTMGCGAGAASVSAAVLAKDAESLFAPPKPKI